MSEWRERRVAFRVRASELTLFTAHRTLAVKTFGLSDVTFEAEPKAILDEQFPEADGLLLRSLRMERSLRTLRIAGGVLRYVPRHYRRYFVDLSLSVEQYEKKFSSKSRSTFRRKARRFAKSSGGTIDWREYRTPSEVAVFYDLAREVSRRTYQERLLDAGLPDTDAFRTQMLAAAANDAVRAYLIFLENKPVAYLYCPVDDGVLKYSYLGYLPDPNIASLSPGTVLLWTVIRTLLERGGYRAFDFTEGGDRRNRDQKALFATDHLDCADVFYLRLTLFNLFLASTQAAVEGGIELIGDVLERFGLRRRVRRLVRALGGVR